MRPTTRTIDVIALSTVGTVAGLVFGLGAGTVIFSSSEGEPTYTVDSEEYPFGVGDPTNQPSKEEDSMTNQPTEDSSNVEETNQPVEDQPTNQPEDGERSSNREEGASNEQEGASNEQEVTTQEDGGESSNEEPPTSQEDGDETPTTDPTPNPEPTLEDRFPNVETRESMPYGYSDNNPLHPTNYSGPDWDFRVRQPGNPEFPCYIYFSESRGAARMICVLGGESDTRMWPIGNPGGGD